MCSRLLLGHRSMIPGRWTQGGKRTDRAQPGGLRRGVETAPVSCIDFFWNEKASTYRCASQGLVQCHTPLLVKPHAFRLAVVGQLVGRPDCRIDLRGGATLPCLCDDREGEGEGEREVDTQILQARPTGHERGAMLAKTPKTPQDVCRELGWTVWYGHQEIRLEHPNSL